MLRYYRNHPAPPQPSSRLPLCLAVSPSAIYSSRPVPCGFPARSRSSELIPVFTFPIRIHHKREVRHRSRPVAIPEQFPLIRRDPVPLHRHIIKRPLPEHRPVRRSSRYSHLQCPRLTHIGKGKELMQTQVVFNSSLRLVRLRDALHARHHEVEPVGEKN